MKVQLKKTIQNESFLTNLPRHLDYEHCNISRLVGSNIKDMASQTQKSLNISEKLALKD